MIFRLIIVSLLFLNGCVTAKQVTPFDISVNEIKNTKSGDPRYELLFKLRNTTNSTIEIDISTLSLDSIEFEFFDRQKKVDLKQMSPIEDYIKRTIPIKPNAVFQKRISLFSYYPELFNELQKHDLDLFWSSQIVVYNAKGTHDLLKKFDVKDKILLTKIQ